MQSSPKWCFLALLFISLSTPFFAISQQDVIPIYLRDDVYHDYVRFLDGETPDKINDFSGKFIRRDVVDMIIAQKALHLGGFKKRFDYQVGKVNFRNTRLLEQGELLISFDTYWYQDAKLLEEKVLISEPVIRKGEYYAGIFTAPDNQAVFKIQHLSDFNQLTSVSTPRWRTDWRTLAQLPLKNLIREDEWLSQVRMVSMQWVDFMLMPLMPAINNHYELENITLKAIPKVLILLDDSRHFVVSKLHPEGYRAFAALQKGLQIMRDQGAIERAYRQAGFIPELTDQVIINLPLTRKLVQNSSLK
ncbi:MULTISPECIES: hypothetical protein [unclassified Pseudoalteromonas]|uniref:hypothetical protein n=1 Tax=unclassified Pseudoalteromonas TaxID=194690 RepID=UPI000B582CBC|nr:MULTISPECIES: hypothetical protein [unclassified Pseudoalteromonas]MDN3379197.1 hypothetical protein [Pseudoalteromonas sp. APC 3893]MDN3386371.1 hypothetical protein [Pseudoalteromonas sp. APC 4017]OUS71225.1 hypothetical protein B5G52_11845 [Pseudoalteromonas sp. A601]